MTNTPPVDMPEAPASVTFKCRTKSGWEPQFTLRDWSEEAMLARFVAFVLKLEASGVEPLNPPVGAQPVRQAAQPAPELPIAGSPAPQKAEELSFEAETLVGSMNEGKRYWKVKGGRFSKFGVTIWPEAARESGFDLDGADISKVYELKNMVAHYVLNEKGQPEKVTRLVYK